VKSKVRIAGDYLDFTVSRNRKNDNQTKRKNIIKAIKKIKLKIKVKNEIK